MFKYLLSIITGGLKTSRDFENAKRAKIQHNYLELFEEVKNDVRRTELKRTGLLQSDDYCAKLAKISIEYGQMKGELDEFYNFVPNEGGGNA